MKTVTGKKPEPKFQASLPAFVERMGDAKSDPGVQMSRIVWNEREKFVCWPKRPLLFWPGLTRSKDGKSKNCYGECPVEQRRQLGDMEPDLRNNGPAIQSFLLAQGTRPRRTDMPAFGWSIHHIYDGRFPADHEHRPTWAAYHGNYFTEAAGLVALHPIADALAAHIGFFVWLLRYEAFTRFDFDPDGVFRRLS